MESGNPQISVIVPVYNVEKYLSHCIDSILSQAFNDFELLLINDGSKDNSGRICDEYAKNDYRIKVYHKENGGVSSARNIGLDHAAGDWIMFIDADDEIQEETISDIYDYYIRLFDDIDIITYPAIYNYKSPFEKYIKQQFCYCSTQKELLAEILKTNRGYEVWNYVIKRNAIDKIRFPFDVKIGEDIIFLNQILKKINKGVVADKGCYLYYYRESSAMSNITNTKERYTYDYIILKRLNEILSDRRDLFIDFIYSYCRYFMLNKISKQDYRPLLKDVILDCSIYDILSSHLSLKRKLIVYLCKLFINHF